MSTSNQRLVALFSPPINWWDGKAVSEQEVQVALSERINTLEVIPWWVWLLSPIGFAFGVIVFSAFMFNPVGAVIVSLMVVPAMVIVAAILFAVVTVVRALTESVA